MAGYIEGKYTGTRYVHSRAQIEAKIWYSKKERAYFSQQIHTQTGNIETKYEMIIKNFKIKGRGLCLNFL